MAERRREGVVTTHQSAPSLEEKQVLMVVFTAK